MARPLRVEYPHAFYHVLSRGNESKAICRTEQDYELFLNTLKDCVDFYGVKIHAYCLMSNHFHLLVETPEPCLSKFMKRLLGVYTLRFNRRHHRHGHLFQGRYKAILVDEDTYFLPLSRYIHLNPVKAGIVQDPKTYLWSSFRYFAGGPPPEFLSTEFTFGLFSSKREYVKFVQDGLALREDPLKDAIGGLLLGSKKFIERFQENIKHADSKIISRANRLNVKFTLIIGQKEAIDKTVILREMDSGIQEVVPMNGIIEAVKKRLKS